MANLLGKASDWIQAKRREHLSISVEYRRGGETIPITAAVGSTRFELADDQGIMQAFTSRDYLVGVDQIDGEPIVGDRIVDAGVSYEVTPPAGQPHWQFSDRNRSTYRIHVKEVAA